MINIGKASISGTRGNGILENFLTQHRVNMANRLIPTEARKGRILDLGCGSSPIFLNQTTFKEKYGLDKVAPKVTHGNIKFTAMDFEKESTLPYSNNFFDVVTLLAVIEHIEPEKALTLLHEIGKILKPNGLLILTTPAAWADRLLWCMAKLNLVSSEEIEEHKDLFTQKTLVSSIKKSGFPYKNIESGSFECFANLWLRAYKVPTIN